MHASYLMGDILPSYRNQYDDLWWSHKRIWKRSFALSPSPILCAENTIFSRSVHRTLRFVSWKFALFNYFLSMYYFLIHRRTAYFNTWTQTDVCTHTSEHRVLWPAPPPPHTQLARGRQVITKREITSALAERREIKYYSGEEVEKGSGGGVKKNNGKLRILIARTTVRYFSLFYLFPLYSPVAILSPSLPLRGQFSNLSHGTRAINLRDVWPETSSARAVVGKTVLFTIYIYKSMCALYIPQKIHGIHHVYRGAGGSHETFWMEKRKRTNGQVIIRILHTWCGDDRFYAEKKVWVARALSFWGAETSSNRKCIK